MAICPLAATDNGSGVRALSFGFGPLGAPALTSSHRSERRKTLDFIIQIYLEALEKNKAEKIIFARHPLNQDMLDCGRLDFKYCFELLRYQFFYLVENILAIDLTREEEDLVKEVGKYHYRHIKRTRKKGVAAKVFNSSENSKELDKRFSEFRQAHFAASGKKTRPDETWDIMHQCLREKKASLFAAFYDNEPISFLFAGEWNKMAFGWSQANLLEREKEFSPRHMLEWEAMLYYKKQGFEFYELGRMHYGAQPFYVSSPKEKSISVFKERYGGVLLPKITWTGYKNPKLQKYEVEALIGRYLKEDNIIKIPQS